MTSETDEILLGRAVAGDLDAFDLLIDRHAAWVIGWLAARVPVGVDPDDLAQEVFMVVYRNREAIRKQKSFSSYVFGVARRILLAEGRRTRRRVEAVRTLGEKAEATAARLESFELLDCEALRNAVRSLPDELGEVVHVYYSSKVTYEEAAGVLGVSRATVQSRLRRALKLLRSRLGVQLLSGGRPL